MDLSTAKARWAFLKNAYNGEGGFKDGGYLVQFPREVDEKFASRKKINYYVNYTKQTVSRFENYLFKKKASRSVKDELISLILDDADMGKNSLSIFMQDVFKDAFLYGASLVLCDMPSSLPKSLAEQKSVRAVPYFVKINPMNLFDYEVKNGSFEWVILEYNLEIKEPFGEKKSVTEYHYYDKMKFERRDKDKNIIKSMEHNLGVCPVLFFSFTRELLDETLIYEISDISKRIYNARSELDEILRGQTFSILAYHAPDGQVTPEELKVSTDNVLLYPQNAPEFISPSQNSSEIYMNYIEKLENKIDGIGLNPSNFSSRSSETGIALQFKLETLNSTLLTYSRALEDFERKLIEICFLRLNRAYDYELSYPSDFQIADVNAKVTEALALKEFEMPKSWERAKKKELARLDLAGLDDEEMSEIYDEITQGKELD